MKRISYLVALVFVLALIFQWAAIAAAPTTHPAGKAPAPTSKMVTKPAKAPAVEEIKVALTDYKIALTPDRAKPGKVRFMIRNSGKVVHGFQITGNGVNQKTPDLKAGQTRQLTVDLKTGTYKVLSPVGSDAKKGMRGTFMVR